MNDRDDHVIPYEEAVRRHRAREEQKRKGVIHEVKISDAMSHLARGGGAAGRGRPDAGPLRQHRRARVLGGRAPDGGD